MHPFLINKWFKTFNFKCVSIGNTCRRRACVVQLNSGNRGSQSVSFNGKMCIIVYQLGDLHPLTSPGFKVHWRSVSIIWTVHLAWQMKRWIYIYKFFILTLFLWLEIDAFRGLLNINKVLKKIHFWKSKLGNHIIRSIIHTRARFWTFIFHKTLCKKIFSWGFYFKTGETFTRAGGCFKLIVV